MGSKRSLCHMFFDVKFYGRRKARFVAGGHLTLDPGEDAYFGVVAPEAIRLALFAAAHNDLKIMAADIGNAYLHAKTKEKLYTIVGRSMTSYRRESIDLSKGIVWIKKFRSKVP